MHLDEELKVSVSREFFSQDVIWRRQAWTSVEGLIMSLLLGILQFQAEKMDMEK